MPTRHCPNKELKIEKKHTFFNAEFTILEMQGLSFIKRY